MYVDLEIPKLMLVMSKVDTGNHDFWRIFFLENVSHVIMKEENKIVSFISPLIISSFLWNSRWRWFIVTYGHKKRLYYHIFITSLKIALKPDNPVQEKFICNVTITKGWATINSEGNRAWLPATKYQWLVAMESPGETD